jgi:hypothetical protein
MPMKRIASCGPRCMEHVHSSLSGVTPNAPSLILISLQEAISDHEVIASIGRDDQA